MRSTGPRILISIVAATALWTAAAQAEPPRTEEEYAALMAEVGTTFQSLQKGANSTEPGDPEADARKLAELFADVERFWTSYGKKDAATWAYRARLYSAQVESRISAAERERGDGHVNRTSVVQFKRLRAAVVNLGAMCKQCHTTYRVGDEETGFQIKPGTLW